MKTSIVTTFPATTPITALLAEWEATAAMYRGDTVEDSPEDEAVMAAADALEDRMTAAPALGYIDLAAKLGTWFHDRGFDPDTMDISDEFVDAGDMKVLAVYRDAIRLAGAVPQVQVAEDRILALASRLPGMWATENEKRGGANLAEIHATEDLIASIPATTLAGAAAQICVAGGWLDVMRNSTMPPELEKEMQDKISRCMFAAFAVMCEAAGVNPAGIGGDSYLPARMNPFTAPQQAEAAE